MFTDADVRFEPDVLRYDDRAGGRKALGSPDAAVPRRKCSRVGEKIAMTFFGMAFLIGLRPWRVSNPKSSSYVGIGAFQLIRRSAYEKMGTHRRLAMEVVDDVKLGKLVKEAGLRVWDREGWNGGERVLAFWGCVTSFAEPPRIFLRRLDSDCGSFAFKLLGS